MSRDPQAGKPSGDPQAGKPASDPGLFSSSPLRFSGPLASHLYSRTTLPTAATVAGVIAALYFGQDVFLPVAIALLLTFALAPLVSLLRRIGVPRIPAVICCVLMAVTTMALFSFMIVTQLGEMARNTTTYQYNILAKVQQLKAAGSSGGVVEGLGQVIERVGREIEKESRSVETIDDEVEPDPLKVEVIARQRPIETLQNLISPLISPLSTTGLVIVVVIFMLLERENLRDRFIRLVGYGDLHRTTEALQDAGRLVGQYLLMQLVVNVLYSIPIGIGLWILGIPNPLLWALLTLVLRFVPYIGPAIGMLLPLFLALAVSPGWSLLLWTAALFLVMELISNNIVEPWLYGSRTGLSPLAVILAAIFWTWLWGPLGLVLSTPLTVCLVVLGKHVPQFEFLEVLFGNQQVLDPRARMYQRLLAGDPDEATDHAEELLKQGSLVDFYDKVAIPALMLGERDRTRGVLDDAQRGRLGRSATTLVANLEDIAREEAEKEDAGTVDIATGDAGVEPLADAGVPQEETMELPDGTGHAVLCVGGRGELDDAAAAMLAQVLLSQGATANTASYADIDPAAIRGLDLTGVDTVIVGFLNVNSVTHARIAVRRLKRLQPRLRVGIVLWSDTGIEKDTDDRRRQLVAESRAHFVAFGVVDAVLGAFAVETRKPADVSPAAGTGQEKAVAPR